MNTEREDVLAQIDKDIVRQKHIIRSANNKGNSEQVRKNEAQTELANLQRQRAWVLRQNP